MADTPAKTPAKTPKAPDDSRFHTSTPEANRAVHNGQGVGQKELNAMADPDEEIPVLAPEAPEADDKA